MTPGSLPPVEHEGRDGTAPEEVIAVRAVVQRLLRPGARFTDTRGVTRPLLAEDVLVIAPFNRHVDALAGGLGAGAKVGTVDKLQGQEPPVVVYALGVSSQGLAPRGIEFLFDCTASTWPSPARRRGRSWWRPRSCSRRCRGR